MATDLTSGSVSRHLRVQATPMAIGLVAIISFDVVDLFFVSRLGDAPLAAISFTFPVIWFLGSVAIGYEAGAASCISRAAGDANRGRAARLTTDAALLAGLATLVLCAIGLMTIDPVFSALGATEELMPLITDYMSIWYWTEPASAVMWTCLASMRARGNTALEGKVITAAAILNAILDPIFIFGWFGFPRLEIAGAALASLTATLTMLTFTLIYLSTRLRVFANPIVPLARIAESWRNLLRIGLPAMLTNVIIPIANGIVMAIVATHGVNAVAGFGIAMRIEPVALIPFYALSAVSSPFFGQNVAAGKHDRLIEARRVIGPVLSPLRSPARSGAVPGRPAAVSAVYTVDRDPRGGGRLHLVGFAELRRVRSGDVRQCRIQRNRAPAAGCRDFVYAGDFRLPAAGLCRTLVLRPAGPVRCKRTRQPRHRRVRLSLARQPDLRIAALSRERSRRIHRSLRFDPRGCRS